MFLRHSWFQRAACAIRCHPLPIAKGLHSAPSNRFLTPALNAPYRDIYPDTWVATDAIGRTMPDYSVVGPVKEDQRRVVGIFYITWHSDRLAKFSRAPMPPT